MPINGTQSQARRRTTPNSYTGGDIAPLPISSTGLIYVRHSIDPSGVHSQLWLQTRAGFFGTPLTNAADDCSQPALSPDGTQMAMICSHGSQTARLEIAPFNGTTLGAHRVLVAAGLNAVPTWSPDGRGIAYLAPGVAAGPFQLWFLPNNAYNPPPPSPIAIPTPTPGGPHNGPLPTPSQSAAPAAPVVKPIQVTTNLGFDATSPMAWLG